MTAPRLVVLAVMLASGATALAVPPRIVHHGCTKPGCVWGIPDQEYAYRSRSASDSAISLTAVLLRKCTMEVDVDVGPPAVPLQMLPAPLNSWDPPRVHDRNSSTDRVPEFLPAPQATRKTVICLYQLDRDTLKVDQCEISQVALQLHEDGKWVFSLRADQNRRPPPDQPLPYNPRLHIKRNQFVVRLRCLGNVETKPAAGVPAAGKPVLVALNPCEFWVENGTPRYVHTGAVQPSIRDYFQDIDRVEIEFYYR